MRALTVRPGRAGSAALEEVPEPVEGGGLLVEALALGICGTDAEILEGAFGEAPAGRERLVLGHESLGRVLDAPAGSGFARGDLVAGVVRRPDPEPCGPCGAGEWDFCANGGYTERGIKALDGFGSERWRLEPGFAVRVDPGLGLLGVLVEPASVVAKAWEQIERVAARATPRGRTVLVTGAGPIGLLAALLAVQRGLETHVLDRYATGPKPALVRALGATYHHGRAAEVAPRADVVLECTGAAPVVLDVLEHLAPNAIACLLGLGAGGEALPVDVAALTRRLVLGNAVVLGAVNANRRHYEAAGRALARADRAWLERLLSRRVPLAQWRAALERRPDDVKVVLEFGETAA